MHIEEFGEGLPVLLLHGSPQPPESLRPLAEVIGRRHWALLAHLPGYGSSAPHEAGASLAVTESALVDTLERRGISKLGIVGFSGGSYRAFSLALSRRLEVTSIVALAPFAGFDAPEMQVFAAFAQALESSSAQEVGALLPARFLSEQWRAAHPEAAAEVARWIAASSPEHLAAELRSWAQAADLRESLHALECSVALRVGELDLATPADHARELAGKIPRAQLAVVSRVGHLLLWEDFAPTAEFVMEALG